MALGWPEWAHTACVCAASSPSPSRYAAGHAPSRAKGVDGSGAAADGGRHGFTDSLPSTRWGSRRHTRDHESRTLIEWRHPCPRQRGGREQREASTGRPLVHDASPLPTAPGNPPFAACSRRARAPRHPQRVEVRFTRVPLQLAFRAQPTNGRGLEVDARREQALGRELDVRSTTTPAGVRAHRLLKFPAGPSRSHAAAESRAQRWSATARIFGAVGSGRGDPNCHAVTFSGTISDSASPNDAGQRVDAVASADRRRTEVEGSARRRRTRGHASRDLGSGASIATAR